MDNLMEDSVAADCLICFSRIGKPVLLPDEESLKIVNKLCSFLHENIAISKLKTGKWTNGNHLPFCKECFDAGFELIQISEQMAKLQKQTLDLSFAFSFAVLLRRTKVDENANNKTDVQNSPKQLIVLDVSALSPSLFSVDQSYPTKTEDFEHPCDDNFIGTDAMLKVPQEDPMEIEIHEFKVAVDVDDNPTVLCHDTTANSIPIVQEEVNQDCFTVSKTKRTYPANQTEVAIRSNNTSRTADSGSGEPDKNITKEIPACTLPVVMLTKLKKVNVSAKVNSTPEQLSSDSSNLKHRLRKKSSKKDVGGQSASSNVIHKKTDSRRLKKVIKSGSSLKVGGRPRATTVKREEYECFACEKVFANTVLLDQHIQIHTGEKSWKCSVCTETFSGLRSLRIHERIHTGFTGKKPTQTTKCLYCPSRFKRLLHLRYHEYTHTGEKPFKCSVCKIGFFNLGLLRRHESIATHSH